MIDEEALDNETGESGKFQAKLKDEYEDRVKLSGRQLERQE
jgi:hypothetical protein